MILIFENAPILHYTPYETQYYENSHSIVKPTITDQKQEIFEWMTFLQYYELCIIFYLRSIVLEWWNRILVLILVQF